jgi:hypothetical protein
MFLDDSRALQPPPSITVDVDSACGTAKGFQAFANGWRWFPFSPLVLSGRTHGVSLEIAHPEAPDGTLLVAPELLPNIHIGELLHWKDMQIYAVFPKLYLRRKDSRSKSVYLTDQQRRDLYEKVFYPAFQRSMTTSDLSPVPRTFHVSRLESKARADESGHRSGGSHSSLLSIAVNPYVNAPLDRKLRALIHDGGLDDFEDMRIWFVAKGFKTQYRMKTYTELLLKWSTHWNLNLDSVYAPPHLHWWDIGRQFLPGHDADDDGRVLLWKSCCMKKYWQSRTKQFNLGKTLPLCKHHMAGMRDVISVTMTAQVGSAASRAGAPYTQFYSTVKHPFISATIEVYQSPSIPLLVHGVSHAEAVASAGHAHVASIAEAAQPFLSSTDRTCLAIEGFVEGKPGEAREEHRLRGDVALTVLTRLAHAEAETAPEGDEEYSQDGHLPLQSRDVMTVYERRLATTAAQLLQHTEPGCHIRHLPFWAPYSSDFGGLLRGNFNNALMGFNMVLRDIHSIHVPQPVTATGLLFLQLLRFCLLSKSLNLAPELYRRRWTHVPTPADDPFGSDPNPSSDEEAPTEVISEGLGMYATMKEFGFAHFTPDIIRFDQWRIHEDHAENFFRREPAFALAMRARRQQVLRFDESMQIIELISQWLSASRSATHTAHILDFATGFLMIYYRHAIWAHFQTTKALDHLSDQERETLLSGAVPISYSNVCRYIRDPDKLAPLKPDLSSSNANFHQGDPNLVLEYIFGFGDTYTPPVGKGKVGTKKRDHWANRGFRVAFAQVYDLLSDSLTEDAVIQWKRNFYNIVHVTNPLLPLPDGTVLVQRKHGNKGYCWLAYDWPYYDLGLLTAPISCSRLLRLVYPRNDQLATTWEFKVKGRWFQGTPPRLLYEDEFFQQLTHRIRRRMERKLQ